MQVVGVRELKAHLSRYLAGVRAGERIVITARGEQVAELVPVSGELQTLAQLAREGRLSWSGRRPVFRPATGYTGPSLADEVLEQRADRERAVLGGAE
jgi:prevent-host-death family protein